MTDHTWTGTPDDRSYVAGRTVSYALTGPAEHLIARLQQIVDDHPDLDPRDIRGNCMLFVAPGMAEVEDASLQDRAEAAALDAHREDGTE